MNFDVIGDASHRKATADMFTDEEIAALIMDRASFRVYQVAKGDEVQQWIAQAVRMARGEEEIR